MPFGKRPNVAVWRREENVEHNTVSFFFVALARLDDSVDQAQMDSVDSLPFPRLSLSQRNGKNKNQQVQAQGQSKQAQANIQRGR